MKRTWFVSGVVGVVLALGCGEDPASSGGDVPLGEVVPDFTLSDVNPNSATQGQGVSPRQRLVEISAWYFGHAT